MNIKTHLRLLYGYNYTCTQHSIKIAVNCLHLLEEVVMLRFSIVRRSYESQPQRCSISMSNDYGDIGKWLGKEVNDVLSIMNRYIGK